MRLLIAGQVRVYREGLERVLERVDGYEVVGTAATSADVLRMAGDLSPDVILLDLGLPQMSALVRELADRAEKVVVLGANDADDVIMPLIEEGVSGYVTRDGSIADMVAAVDGAARGESVVSPRLVAGMMERLATLTRERRSTQSPDTLTLREREIASLIDEGLSNREIALRLRIKLPTVKSHVHNILEKLRVHRRGEAVARLRSVPSRPVTRSSALARRGSTPR